jgi:hypothetical protein
MSLTPCITSPSMQILRPWGIPTVIVIVLAWVAGPGAVGACADAVTVMTFLAATYVRTTHRDRPAAP